MTGHWYLGSRVGWLRRPHDLHIVVLAWSFIFQRTPTGTRTSMCFGRALAITVETGNPFPFVPIEEHFV